MPARLDPKLVEKLLDLALNEDLPAGDITTNSIFSKETATARITAKEHGIIAGLPLIQHIFHKLDSQISIQLHVSEGDLVDKGTSIATIQGSMVGLLQGERICLNVLQRLSGIATATYQYVQLLTSSKTKIVDTRKTLPGWRYLDKYAVTVGGGWNHRLSLSDAVMIKDNHIKGAGGIISAVERVRNQIPITAKIEVEVTNQAEILQALAAHADIIMLDNMHLAAIKAGIETIGGQAKVEISGNVSLESLPQLANLGADYISVGALTHSVQAFDLSMNIIL